VTHTESWPDCGAMSMGNMMNEDNLLANQCAAAPLSSRTVRVFVSDSCSRPVVSGGGR
jgi:hypothetical protein